MRLYEDWQASSQSAGYLYPGVEPISPCGVSWSAFSAALKESSYVLEANLVLDSMPFGGDGRCQCDLAKDEFGIKSQCDFVTAKFGSKFNDSWLHIQLMLF